MPEHSNGTTQAASRETETAPIRLLPSPLPLPPARPFERSLAFIRRYRRRLLAIAAASLAWSALLTWYTPQWDGWSLLTCFVGGAVTGFCLGLRHGLGDTQRTLDFVLRHLRREEGPHGDRPKGTRSPWDPEEHR